MRSIKARILVTVIVCTLLSSLICGGVSIVNSSRTVYADSQKEMQYACANQASALNAQMSRVEQSVNTAYNVALQQLTDVEAFKTSKAYVDNFTAVMNEMLYEVGGNTEGALTAYIRYNPEFTEPDSGVFWSRSSDAEKFEALVPTDFSMYSPDDLEHVGWYYIPVQNGKPTWMDPYLNSNINVYMVSYVIPIVINGESIGIIGIALILALSTGINTYINQVQEDTLSSYPITIQAESTDMTALMASLMGARHSEAGGSGGSVNPDPDRVYASTVMYDMMDSMLNAEVETNNLEAFKEYLDNGGGGIKDMANVHYSYDFDFDIYTQDENGDIIQCDVMTLMQDAMSAMYGGDYSSYFEQMGSMYSAMDVWEELLPGEGGELIAPQAKADYELLYGSWPENYDEVILFVDGNNEISDLMLYALGLMPHDDMEEAMVSMSKGETVELGELSWSYEELCELGFKLILPAEYYQHDPAADTYTDMSKTGAGMDFLYNSEDVGIRLKISGIARPVEGGPGIASGGIGYTSALTRYAIETTGETEILKKQLDDPDTDVISGLPFPKESDVEPTDEEKADAVTEYLSALTASEKAAAYVDVMGQPSQEYVDGVVSQQMDGLTREAIEDMIVEQYAGEMGVDGDTVRGYIADMSDEELFSKVEEAIVQSVREQYAAGVEQQLAALPQDQLAGMLDAALELGSAGETDEAVPEPEPALPAGMDPSMAAGMGGMGGSPAMVGPGPFGLEQFVYLYDHYMPPTRSSSTYEDNLDLLGCTRLEAPSAISIYATTFAQKDQIADLIQDYNDGVSSEDDEITYTDYVALLMSSITGIISGISYLLIAFVSISLVVSSIMIGIITNISVLERTKEIGILRAVGASKRDVSRVFNAETLIVGLAAGVLGILVSVAATVPINAVIHNLTGLDDLTAVLPPAAGAILVAISVILTVFAGLVPSRGAAKKDPVEALRSE